MVTKRTRAPQGMHADTDAYTFMCRLKQDDRLKLRKAHARLVKDLGDLPSNAVFLSELLDCYLSRAA